MLDFPTHNDHITLTPAVALALSPTSRNYGLLRSVAPYAEQLQGSHGNSPWRVNGRSRTPPPLLWSIPSS